MLALTTEQSRQLREQTTQMLTQAEQRLAAATAAVEAYIAERGLAGLTNREVRGLDVEYRKSQRHLRACRTLYARLANQYHWEMPR